MRAMFRLLAAVALTGGAVGAAVAPSAFADTATPTTLTLGEVQPFPAYQIPSLLHPEIILTGTLWDAQTNAVITTPEPVTVYEQVAGTGPQVIVASTQTDANGNFDVNLDPVTAGGIFVAEFGGDGQNGYAASTSEQVNVVPAASSVTQQLTFKPACPRPGKALTIAGQAFATDDFGTTTVPVAGATVTLYELAEPTSVQTTTGPDGSFTLSFRVTAGTDPYLELDATEPWPYSLYAGNITPIPVTAHPGKC